jgi:hypothetical protein
MISDSDILAGIREAGHDAPGWASAALGGPCPSPQDISPRLSAHFGVTFAAGELEAIATVDALVALLRLKFDGD